MNDDAIAGYAAKLDAQRADICANLSGVFSELLPQAQGKLWHGIPVWFIGENPVVGYTARKKGVMLMFWNGQSFAEPELEASGSFHMAQIAYDDASQIDRHKLAGWLQKAGTSIWDMTGERNAFVAKRRAAKAKAAAKAAPKKKAAKPKPKAETKSKAKTGVKARKRAKTAKSAVKRRPARAKAKK